MSDKPTPAHQHAARDCRLCATLRHPAQAKNGRALTVHLKTNPLPRQTAASR